MCVTCHVCDMSCVWHVMCVTWRTFEFILVMWLICMRQKEEHPTHTQENSKKNDTTIAHTHTHTRTHALTRTHIHTHTHEHTHNSSICAMWLIDAFVCVTWLNRVHKKDAHTPTHPKTRMSHEWVTDDIQSTPTHPKIPMSHEWGTWHIPTHNTNESRHTPKWAISRIRIHNTNESHHTYAIRVRKNHSCTQKRASRPHAPKKKYKKKNRTQFTHNHAHTKQMPLTIRSPPTFPAKIWEIKNSELVRVA